MDWHSRFLQQAAWTRDLRGYLFERTGLKNARRVLEVGCGTGAILSGLETSAAIHGLDLDFNRLLEAHSHVTPVLLTSGDALALPYSSAFFDITFCHFLLLWVRLPLVVLTEMKRVTRPGGAVLALAEPDYYSRLDEPAELAPLGRWQTESIARQGADPGVGKRLADLFRQSGIPIVESGPLEAMPASGGTSLDIFGAGRQGGQVPLTPSDRAMEWEVLEADLEGRIPSDEIRRLKFLDEQAWARGERVLHVPTYFAWGVV